VLGLCVCIACVAVVRRVRALVVWSSDYRSDDDQVGAPVVVCIVWTGGVKGAQKVVVVDGGGRLS
jgi:hypothetical protein